MMKIKILFFLLLIFSTSTMGAQQMEMVKKPLDAPEFYQNGKKYKMGELVILMRPHYEAVDYMKKARTNYIFSQIFAFSGAGLVGYPIGTSLGGVETHSGELLLQVQALWLFLFHFWLQQIKTEESQWKYTMKV